MKVVSDNFLGLGFLCFLIRLKFKKIGKTHQNRYDLSIILLLKLVQKICNPKLYPYSKFCLSWPFLVVHRQIIFYFK